MERQLSEQLKRFDAAHRQTLAEIEERRSSELNEIEQTFAYQSSAIARQRASELEAADRAHQQ
ncbi:MAG: hypothetical protein R3357_14835, partial [Burkholderiales bacterium]|nr:hypothetical protein [Burkholderiales bacterium]